MNRPRYTPHTQLDMFAPVQLGMGIDPAPPAHLTDAEAEHLANVISSRVRLCHRGSFEQAIAPYGLDAASTYLVLTMLEREDDPR